MRSSRSAGSSAGSPAVPWACSWPPRSCSCRTSSRCGFTRGPGTRPATAPGKGEAASSAGPTAAAQTVSQAGSSGSGRATWALRASVARLSGTGRPQPARKTASAGDRGRGLRPGQGLMHLAGGALGGGDLAAGHAAAVERSHRGRRWRRGPRGRALCRISADRNMSQIIRLTALEGLNVSCLHVRGLVVDAPGGRCPT